MEHYFNPEVECASREQITAWQNERLVKQVERVYNTVPYYRKKMDDLGVKPSDIHGIQDLHLLPTMTKDDLRDQYPSGLLAVPMSECVRIHSTSGTTGRRVVAYYTQRVRPKMMSYRSATDTASSPAEQDSTAAPTNWEA